MGTHRSLHLEESRASRPRVVVPAFIGVGAMKAGTTMLYEALRRHPDLGLAKKKEVHFFDLHYRRGLDWYRSQFDTSTERALVGEITPNYLFDARCAARIANHFPHVGIIVCIRDPISRAYSQFKQWVRDTGYRKGFAEFLDEHPNAFERGLYAKQLARYGGYFAPSRVHILVFEDLIAAPMTALDETWDFLDVRRPSRLELPDEPVHETVRPRHRRAYATAKRIRGALYRRDVTWPVELGRRLGAASVLAGRATSREFPPMAPATVTRLREQYHADIQAVSRTLGRDMGDVWTLSCAGSPEERG